MKYTRENPFYDDNWTAYRNEGGQVVTSFRSHSPSTVSREHAELLHAFIEAERDTWHWTNAGHIEARNGRWVAIKDYMPCGWAMTHEDFPRSVWRDDQGVWGTSHQRTARRKLDEFLAWRAANHPDPKDLPLPEVGEWVWVERLAKEIRAGWVKRVALGEVFIDDPLGSPGEYAGCINPAHASITAWGLIDPADLEPEFTPLPVPDVGTYIQATYADGHVKTGEVEEHWVFEDYVGMQIAGGYGIILTKPRDTSELIDITEWHEVERPKSPDLDAAFSDALDALNRLGSTLREAKS